MAPESVPDMGFISNTYGNITGTEKNNYLTDRQQGFAQECCSFMAMTAGSVPDMGLISNAYGNITGTEKRSLRAPFPALKPTTQHGAVGFLSVVHAFFNMDVRSSFQSFAFGMTDSKSLLRALHCSPAASLSTASTAGSCFRIFSIVCWLATPAIPK